MGVYQTTESAKFWLDYTDWKQKERKVMDRLKQMETVQPAKKEESHNGPSKENKEQSHNVASKAKKEESSEESSDESSVESSNEDNAKKEESSEESSDGDEESSEDDDSSWRITVLAPI